MKLIDKNRFINALGIAFDAPKKCFRIRTIVESKNKVIMLFGIPPDSEEIEIRHRNIICFNRHTGERDWLVEPYTGWMPENNKNLYLKDVIEGSHYGAISAFYKDPSGHLWVEEDCNRSSRNWVSYEELERQGLIARHPQYRNTGCYRIARLQECGVRSDTHELEPIDLGQQAGLTLEQQGYDDMVFYADMTAYDETDCLLAALSAYYVFLFEVDLNTGQVTPAYAMIGETR